MSKYSIEMEKFFIKSNIEGKYINKIISVKAEPSDSNPEETNIQIKFITDTNHPYLLSINRAFFEVGMVEEEEDISMTRFNVSLLTRKDLSLYFKILADKNISFTITDLLIPMDLTIRDIEKKLGYPIKIIG
jgi:hypothetical protein